MCWRPPTAAARWRRSSIHLRARSNAPEMNFLCARAAVQRVAAADALCEQHATMTMECMHFAPHTRPARPHAHTHFAEASSESECALLRLMVPSGPLALHTLYAAVYGVGSLLATSDAVKAAGESGGRAGCVEEALLGPDRS